MVVLDELLQIIYFIINVVPCYVVAVVMISKNGKFSFFRFDLFEVIDPGFDFGRLVIHKISCEDKEIRLLFIDQIDTALHSVSIIKTSGMNI